MLPAILFALTMQIPHVMPTRQAKAVDLALQAVLAKYKDVKQEELGIAFGPVDRAQQKVFLANYRGDQNMYPASVVKMFYAVYATQLLHDGQLQLTPEFERGIHDMIVDSNNDATGLVLDTITHTTGGPELAPKEFTKWQDKRKAVNRFFADRGVTGINACQKTWNEGPYGRERQGYGPNFENRNSLNALACARLMSDIALDQAVQGTAKDTSHNWPVFMKGFFHREVPADSKEPNEQAKGFTGRILPSGSQLWSKAGWVDAQRHDVAWVKMPSGHEYVLAIFTKNHSPNLDLIPFIAREMLKAMGEQVRDLTPAK